MNLQLICSTRLRKLDHSFHTLASTRSYGLSLLPARLVRWKTSMASPSRCSWIHPSAPCPPTYGEINHRPSVDPILPHHPANPGRSTPPTDASLPHAGRQRNGFCASLRPFRSQ